MEQLYQQIAELGKKLRAGKILLYGSRARGDHRARSDIDLAIFGLAEDRRSRFIEGIEALPTLLDFDLVFVSPLTSPALLENIERDGVVLMDRARDKIEKLKSAVTRLEESLAEYDVSPTSVVRDGVIQRFEFCTELAWKSTREYLLDQGYTEINSPKSVMRRAFSDGVISDQDQWISLLDDRNMTSHLYDDGAASQIFERIRGIYLDLFRTLRDRLDEK